MAGALRLLAVTHDYSLSGAPVVLYQGLAGLTQRYDIEVAGPHDGPLRARYAAAGIRATVEPGLLEDAAIGARLLAASDLLLANTIVSFLPVRTAAGLGKPSLWYLHEAQFGLPFMAHYPGIAPALPLAGCIAYPAAFCREIYAPWRAERWTEVLPYGVEEHAPGPPAAAGAALRVLQLGSIEPRKGQDVALAALRLLRDRPVQLDIAGRVLAPEFRRLLDGFADLRSVRYLDEVGLEAATDLVRGCDVLIVPSRDEVTPMVILEAMALGKPVVAARVGAVPEMVADGETGLLFDAGDAAQLAAALERLRADRALRERLGAAGRERQRTHWRLEQYHQRLAAALDALR